MKILCKLLTKHAWLFQLCRRGQSDSERALHGVRHTFKPSRTESRLRGATRQSPNNQRPHLTLAMDCGQCPLDIAFY